MTSLNDVSDNGFWAPQLDIVSRSDGTIFIQQKAELETPTDTLPQRLAMWARERADSVFIGQRDELGVWRELTYAQTYMHVREVGYRLLEMHLSPDKPVVILSENSIDHAILALASQSVGVPYAPVSPNYSLLSNDHRTLRYICEKIKPGLIYASNGRAYAKALRAVADRHVHICVSKESQTSQTISFDTLLHKGNDHIKQLPEYDESHTGVSPVTVAKYLFTSGTTGSPKAVINTQAMMMNSQAQIADCYRFLNNRPPVVIDWCPWSHTAGSKTFNLALFHGGTFYIDNGKPTLEGIKDTVRILKEKSPTWYFNVPAGYALLVQHLTNDAELRDCFFRQLDMMMYAGAGMSQPIQEQLRAVTQRSTTRSIPLLSGLGATETGPDIFIGGADNESAGNVGVPARGIQLKLVPYGNGYEVRLRSQALTQGYYGDESATKNAYDDEAYFRLGDVVTPVDCNDFNRGFCFSGRLSENFKLDTGTWVMSGNVSADMVNAFGGLLDHVVLIGESRSSISALVFPCTSAVQALLPDNPEDYSLESLLNHPQVIQVFQTHLNTFANRQTGTSRQVGKMLLLSSPPDRDSGELTDKGSICRQAVIKNRSAYVQQLDNIGPGVLIAKF